MEIHLSNWTEILSKKFAHWWESLIAILPNLLIATIVIITFIYLAKFTKKITFRLISRLSSGKHSISGLLSNITYIIVLVLGLFISLNILDLNKAVSSLLAGAGIIGLVLGFAFQDLSSNFISGIFIAVKRPFDIGHTVETNGYTGNVEDIQLRTTTIRTFQGLHVMIPNKEIFQKPFTNFSRSDERRVELAFTIDMGRDLKKVAELCKQAGDSLDYIIKTKPVQVYYTGFGENVIKVAVWFWIYNHKPPGFMVAQNDIIMNIAKSFAENKITLTMPITFQEQKNEALEDTIKNKIINNQEKINA